MQDGVSKWHRGNRLWGDIMKLATGTCANAVYGGQIHFDSLPLGIVDVRDRPSDRNYPWKRCPKITIKLKRGRCIV